MFLRLFLNFTRVPSKARKQMNEPVADKSSYEQLTWLLLFFVLDALVFSFVYSTVNAHGTVGRIKNERATTYAHPLFSWQPEFQWTWVKRQSQSQTVIQSTSFDEAQTYLTVIWHLGEAFLKTQCLALSEHPQAGFLFGDCGVHSHPCEWWWFSFLYFKNRPFIYLLISSARRLVLHRIRNM